MTTEALSLLQGLVASLDPEEAAKHSMLDHHAVGLDYVNLLRTDRLTVKLYVMEPDRIVHAVKRRADVAYLVNPHYYAYAFDTVVLAGHVDDWEFETGGREEWAFDWWSHRLVYDTPTRTIVGRHEGSNLKAKKRLRHRPGARYRHEPRDIHTIAVSRCAVTVMLLLQYADVKTQTNLWVSAGTTPSFEGLYRKPTAADVTRLVARAVEAIS